MGLAGVGLLAYALPLLHPPGPVMLERLPEGAGLLARLYPGIPTGWVAARLGGLLAAALLAASCAAAVRRAARVGEPDLVAARPGPARPLRAGALPAAAALALLHAACAPFVDGLGRGAQLAYVAAFALPAAVLALGTKGGADRREAPPRRVGPILAFAVPIAVWLAWRGADARGSLRPAHAVDTWFGMQMLESAAAGELNLVSGGLLPGITALHLLPQSVAAFGPGLAPSFPAVQLVHLGWLAVLGAGVAWLAARLVAPAAAPIALAAFLGAPFVLAMPLNPSPLFLGCFFAVTLAALLLRFHERRSLVALAGLGALAGVAATHPSTLPLAALAGLGALGSWLRGPRLPWLALAVPLASGAAALVPAIPDLETLEQMRVAYARGSGHWFELEPIILGRHSPFGAEALNEAGRGGTLDVPVAALLAPFAATRTSLRLWGDAAFDPLGAGLAAVGLAAALRVARRRPQLGLLVVWLGVALLPGLSSSYDRATLTRMFAMPVPLALLAALGFETLRAGLAPRARAAVLAWATAAAVAAGGLFLFDVVNPRILIPSSSGLALRALASAPPAGGATFLEHGPPFDLAWLQVRPIARHVPPEPVPVFAYTGVGSLAPGAAPEEELWLWSAGLEEDARLGSVVCRHFPASELHRIEDATGRARAYAARRAGPGWQPAAPELRWRSRPCGSLGRPGTP